MNICDRNDFRSSDRVKEVSAYQGTINVFTTDYKIFTSGNRVIENDFRSSDLIVQSLTIRAKVLNISMSTTEALRATHSEHSKELECAWAVYSFFVQWSHVSMYD